VKKSLLILGLCLLPIVGMAANLDLPAMTVVSEAGQQKYSLSLQILFVMTLLTFIPAMLLMMTSFTRIIIVLSILRQAMGLTQSPSNQILIGLSLFLTFFIMSPVFTKVYTDAITPYVNNQITPQVALDRAQLPVRQFMLHVTRENDLRLFSNMAKLAPNTKLTDLPFTVIMPAFITSELKTAFQIGFLIFLPFLIIDLVVASVLMAMGMMMLSPLVISLPFKILLFVLVDGWTLILGSLARSFM
jgi:flagellar biosynthetic protein FliP